MYGCHWRPSCRMAGGNPNTSNVWLPARVASSYAAIQRGTNTRGSSSLAIMSAMIERCSPVVLLGGSCLTITYPASSFPSYAHSTLGELSPTSKCHRSVSASRTASSRGRSASFANQSSSKSSLIDLTEICLILLLTLGGHLLRNTFSVRIAREPSVFITGERNGLTLTILAIASAKRSGRNTHTSTES